MSTLAQVGFSKGVGGGEGTRRNNEIRKITLNVRGFEIFCDLQKSSECQSNNRKKHFWLQTSLIKLRSAIPLINLAYNILREPLGILSIFVSHFCCRWSLSTLISPKYHVDHGLYFYYRQMLHLNSVTHEIAKYKYICFINIIFIPLYLKYWCIC